MGITMYLTKRDKKVMKVQEQLRDTQPTQAALPTIVVGREKEYFDTRKYANIWNVLKAQLSVEICILDVTQKATVVRGVSQLKNLDTKWKFASTDNYKKRIKVTQLENPNPNQLYLKLELVSCFKYRTKSL